MNFDFCHKICSAGKKASEKILAESDSVSDAAIDFWYFIDECSKTCPYKDNKITNEEEIN